MVKITNTSNKSTDKYSDEPIYPRDFNTSAFPNRVYVWAIERFISISCVLLLSIGILSSIIFYKIKLAKDTGSEIAFVYWDDSAKEFKIKKRTDNANYNEEDVYLYKLLNEKKVEDYIINRFTISSDYVENDKRWCDCHSNNQNSLANNDNSDNENFVRKCLVCDASDEDVWTKFSADDGLVNYNLDMYKKGQVRKVLILNNEILKSTEAETLPAKNIFSTVFGIITSALKIKNSHRNNVFIMYRMKTDFAILDYKNGLPDMTSLEFLTAYSRIYSNGPDYSNRIEDAKIDEFSTIFTPYKNDIYNKYQSEIDRWKLDLSNIYNARIEQWEGGNNSEK